MPGPYQFSPADDLGIPLRFWAKIRMRRSGCWEWTGTRSRDYGRFTMGSRRDKTVRSVWAHRWAYETLIGPIPEGLTIDHLCRYPPCVNPNHMEVVTQGENNRRGYGFAGVHARQTHCVHGHSLEPGPLVRVRTDGSRVCLLCKNGESWRPRAENTCKQGHELTPDNVAVLKNGYRLCRICRRATERKAYHRKVEAALRLDFS